MRQLKSRHRGFTIIEVLAASAVLVVGILVIVSSFSVNLRQSSQTREELLAAVVMESLVEEVGDHQFGSPAPNNWTSGEVRLNEIVEGRTVETVFTQTVTTSRTGGNGSFLGQTGPHQPGSDTDIVTLTITWVQPTGVGNSGQNKRLQADLMVVRKP